MFKIFTILVLFCVFLFSKEIVINGQKIDSKDMNIGAVLDFVQKTKEKGANNQAYAQPFYPEKKWLSCAGCHGDNGDIVVDGTNIKLNELSEDELIKKMLYYKNLKDENSGSNKDFMRAQVFGLTDDNIKSLASYIKNK